MKLLMNRGAWLGAGCGVFLLLAGCGGGDSTANLPTSAKRALLIAGQATDAPLASAKVWATLGGVTYSTQADAAGHYVLAIEYRDMDELLVLQADGVGVQAKVKLQSVVGSIADAVRQAGSDGKLSEQDSAATNITPVSTAVSAAARAAGDGQLPASPMVWLELWGKVAPIAVREATTAIKLVADNQVSLPKGISDTLLLVNDKDVLGTFINEQKKQDQTRWTALNGKGLPGQMLKLTGIVKPITVDFIHGAGLQMQNAMRVTFEPNGSARIVDWLGRRNATWESDASGRTLLKLNQPMVDSSDSLCTFTPPGQQSSVTRYCRREWHSFVLSQLHGELANGFASVGLAGRAKLASPEFGMEAGQDIPEAAKDGSSAEIFRTHTGTYPLAFKESDFAPGSRWAGPIVRWSSTDTYQLAQALLKKEVGALAVLEQERVAFEVEGGMAYQVLLNDPVGPSAVIYARYTRVAVLNDGMERWLAEELDDEGQAKRMVEISAMPAKRDMAFKTDPSRNWLSAVRGAEAWGDVGFYYQFFPDGSARSYDKLSESSGWPGSFWRSEAAETLRIRQTVDMKTNEYGCYDYIPSCVTRRDRSFTLINQKGSRMFVLDGLRMFRTSGSGDYYDSVPTTEQVRLHIYDDVGPSQQGLAPN